jgi:hypothetical protein
MSDLHTLRGGTGISFSDPQGARAGSIEFLRQLGVDVEQIPPEVPTALLVNIVNRLEAVIADGSARGRIGQAAERGAAAGEAAKVAEYQQRRAAGLTFADPPPNRAAMLEELSRLAPGLDNGRLTDLLQHGRRLQAGQAPGVSRFADPGKASDISDARRRELLSHTSLGRAILRDEAAALKGGGQ